MGTMEHAVGPWPAAVLDALAMGIAELDASGAVVRSNAAFALLLGYPSRITPGDSLAAMQWPQVDADQGPRDVLGAVLGAVPVDGIFPVRRIDGLIVEMRVRAIPLGGSTRVTGALVTLADVPAGLAKQHTVGQMAEAYQVMADNLIDVVLVSGPDGITWASPSAHHALGYLPGQLIGQSISEIVHPEDCHLIVVTPGEPTTRVRHRLRRLDGVYRWFETSVTARFDGDQLAAIYSSSRDIEDRVRLEALVEATTRRKHDALDASPDGFAVYRAERDQTGLVTGLRLQFINAAGAAGFAGDAGALIGQDLRDFFPDSVDSGLWADLVTALHTGQLQHSRVEGRGPSWAGSIHGIQARLDADTVMSTWRDISDQVRAEREIAAAHAAASEARNTLQAALEASSDGFVVLDLVRDQHASPTGARVVTSNSAATTSMGLTPDEVRGCDPRTFAPSWERSGIWDHILAASADGRARTIRLHFNDPAGELWVSQDHTISPVGRDRVLLIFRDVTADERGRRELEDSQRAAEHAASHDALTDLPNRALLLQRLEVALTECASDEQVAVIFCDLNDFKGVNDTYGHAAGDAVLTATADRLRSMIRPQDTAARLAGDEFVIVLRNLPRSWAGPEFIDRATDRLSQPVPVGETLLAPSASLGIYLAEPLRRPGTDRTADAVLAHAHHAMYAIKRAHRAGSEHH